jgi:hypothetical protein
MRRRIATVPQVGVLFVLLVLAPAAGKTEPRLETLARAVLHGGPTEAIESLRQEGPAGMEALLAFAGSGASAEETAVDRVCGVRNCADIRLFWYTDLEAAKAAALATGKPILSLRLMGRLDEELSCANSRFFRTVYYKNHEINRLLREQFVLHWRSVRPVPRVTIDFGDGTRLERTITGNSIHYVLDSRGRLVKALPGLSGPVAFRSALQEAERAARLASRLNNAQLVSWRAARHERALDARARALRNDLAALSSVTPAAAPEPPSRIAALAPRPRPEVVDQEVTPSKAGQARDPWAILQATPGALSDRINVSGLETGSKQAAEVGLLRVLDPVSDDQLRALARLRRPRIHLDPASSSFLLRKHGVSEIKEAKRLVETFEATVALDEVINEYRTGPAILRQLSDPGATGDLDLEAFNEWVYEEVFRTPLSDPWLGLAPEDVYAALPASTRTGPPQP